jgi:hypothetical protein
MNLSTPLSLSFSCTDLVNLDHMSLSDPQVWLFAVGSNGVEALHGKTEKVKNSLSPTFATPINVDYRFEEVQTFRICVVDVDHNAGSLREQDLIGETNVTLAKLVASPGGKFTAELHTTKTRAVRGKVTVVCEELGSLNAEIDIVFAAQGLDKKDLFGKSDPYLVISKIREDNSFIKVKQTEVVKSTLSPVWNKFTISAGVLCAGDLDRTIKVQCFDWDANSEHDLIGAATLTVRDLRAGATFALVNPSKAQKKGKSYKDSGTLLVREINITTSYSFIEYLRSGFRINTMMNVDFTASNGDPQHTTSLHYRNPYQPNAYQQAIAAVGTVLLEYDTDKLVAAYGFGGKIPPNNQVSHCFPLTFNLAQVEVPGVPGMLAAYGNALSCVALHGPTNFAPLLQQAQSIAKARSGEYLVVLIITDGTISDVDNTIEAIVDCAALPMSIVIIGVGDADFTQMNVLDGDNGALKDRRGRRAPRDVVQFVAMSGFQGKSMQALAAEVLREVPGQFVAAMKQLGLKPIGAQ